MDISMFLAQVFGLYFIIAGVALLLRPEMITSIIEKFASDRDVVVMWGFMILIIGIPLVLTHSVWDGTWRVLVTILVWITLLKGVARVFMPDATISMGKSFVSNLGMVKGLLVVLVLLGIYLSYIGFGLSA